MSTARFLARRLLHETKQKAGFSGIPRLPDLPGFSECRGHLARRWKIHAESSAHPCAGSPPHRVSTLSAHQKHIPADPGTDTWLAWRSIDNMTKRLTGTQMQSVKGSHSRITCTWRDCADLHSVRSSLSLLVHIQIVQLTVERK